MIDRYAVWMPDDTVKASVEGKCGDFAVLPRKVHDIHKNGRKG